MMLGMRGRAPRTRWCSEELCSSCSSDWEAFNDGRRRLWEWCGKAAGCPRLARSRAAKAIQRWREDRGYYGPLQSSAHFDVGARRPPPSHELAACTKNSGRNSEDQGQKHHGNAKALLRR